ncbi:MAG: hypothetical protein ACMG6S_23460 [Byssovorax sp.]
MVLALLDTSEVLETAAPPLPPVPPVVPGTSPEPQAETRSMPITEPQHIIELFTRPPPIARDSSRIFLEPTRHGNGFIASSEGLESKSRPSCSTSVRHDCRVAVQLDSRERIAAASYVDGKSGTDDVGVVVLNCSHRQLATPFTVWAQS